MAQVTTKVVSLKKIMGRPAFERGYLEAMCGAKLIRTTMIGVPMSSGVTSGDACSSLVRVRCV